MAAVIVANVQTERRMVYTKLAPKSDTYRYRQEGLLLYCYVFYPIDVAVSHLVLLIPCRLAFE